MGKRIVILAALLVAAGCMDSASDTPSASHENQPSGTSGNKLKSMPPNEDVAKSARHPTIDWITIDTEGWELAIDERKMMAWTDKDGDMLSLVLYSRPEVNGNGLPDDFPVLELGQEVLRDFRRSVAKENDSGLVQAEIKSLGQKILASVSITKKRMNPTGFGYTGACIVPRQEFSFWILVSASEKGTTGIRDAVVAKELLEAGEITLELPQNGKTGRMVGFFRDPYDPEHNGGALYNLSDREEYDDQFPDSPLTRVRTKLQKIIDSIALSPEVIDSKRYSGSAESSSKRR